MAASSGFIDLVEDLLSPLGPVVVKRMFGGAGIYIDGRFMAIIDNDVLYFKTDAETRPAFDAEGAPPFVYDTKHGEGQLESYRRVPERLLDDADEMAEWAGAALAVARRAAGTRPARSTPATRARVSRSSKTARERRKPT
ncbi:MAG: TfoX/Sxy family protein [Hyphomicrobium sp.]